MVSPKISVITPSYNQGHFLEETIISVIGQGYQNLEYIIFDGGSTDNTIEIIKKYSNSLSFWVSEKDAGQSNAINKGFERATGDILLWLNSDDLLMPGALSYIAANSDTEKANFYFGNCIHFNHKNGLSSYGSNVKYYHENFLLENADYIIQPSSYFTRKAWEATGNLNEKMHYAFDWEWFLRAKQKQVTFIPINECLSLYRIHDTHKTGTGRDARDEELSFIYKNFSPANEKLFNYLIEDKHFAIKLLPRIIRKLAHIFSYPYSDTKVLKYLKQSRYKKFSEDTINQVKQMVSFYQ